MEPGIYQTWKLAQYIIGIRTEVRQRINTVCCSRGIYLCLFDYNDLFVCVKNRTCLRMAIPAYCFNIFGSSFGVLFYLLIKKLILECKSIWQSMRKFLWAVWRVSTYPHMEKEEGFLPWKLHIGIVSIFQIITLFLLDLKIWKLNFLEIWPQTFLKEKLCCVQMIYIFLLTLNNPFHSAKRLSNIIVR